MLTISLVFAAGCAVLNLWLAMRCGRVRTAEKILHGDGGSPLLVKRMRAHANFAEFTPIVLVLFILVEWALGPSPWLWGVAALYLGGRIAHGIGMDVEDGPVARMIGTLTTFLVTIGLALAALWIGYGQLTMTDAPAEVGTRV